MDKNKVVISIIGVIALFAFLIGAYYATNQPEQVEVYPAVAEINQNDHVKWASNSAVVLVEYSDIQCPACLSFHEQMRIFDQDKQLTENVTFIYRHFPLKASHPNAEEAAWAAEAAAKQGKFYEMLDLQFTNQAAWSAERDPYPKFETYAQELKLDIEQFKSDYASDDVKKRVEADYTSGLAANVGGTPTFYINGKKMIFGSYAEFREQVLEEVEAQKKPQGQ